jgi:hypothetical protein
VYQRANQRSLPFRRQTSRSVRGSLESKWTIPTATTFAALVSAFDDGVCRVYRARASGGAGNELSHYSYSFGYRIVSPSPLSRCQYILFSMLRPSMKVDAHFCGASRQKSSPVRKGHISFLSCRYDPSNGEPRFQTLALTRQTRTSKGVAIDLFTRTDVLREHCHFQSRKGPTSDIHAYLHLLTRSRDWRFGTQRASDQMKAERENKAAQPFAVCQENEQMH